jgi:hypothetical protein
VNFVVLLEVIAGEGAHLEGDELESLGFKAGDDVSDEAALGGIRLEEDERAFQSKRSGSVVGLKK